MTKADRPAKALATEGTGKISLENSSQLTGSGLLREHARLDEENGLPVTSTRNGTWYIIAWHTFTALIGVGPLTLPYAVAQLGWAGGLVVLLLLWAMSLYTMHLLASLSEHEHHRFSRLREMSVYAFGVKTGRLVAIGPQVIELAGFGVLYPIFGGRALQSFWQIVCHKHMQDGGDASGMCTPFGQSAWISVFSCAVIILIQIPDLGHLAPVGACTAFLTFTFHTMAICTAIAIGRQPGVTYARPAGPPAAQAEAIMTAIGTIAFMLSNQALATELQATLPKSPSYRPFMGGTTTAWMLALWVLLGETVGGYHAFGQLTTENILDSLKHPVWLVATANMMVAVFCLGAYQLRAAPILDMIELELARRNRPAGIGTRLIYRTAYVFVLSFIAVTLPFFSDLMSVLAAISTAPITYLLPPFLWLSLRQPRRWTLSWMACHFCIAVGVVVMFVAAIGGVWGIVRRASTYHFYS